MGIATNAIAEIADANEAGDVIYQIMSHFNLAGTVFVPDDIKGYIEDHVSSDPYSEVTADDIDTLVGECIDYGNWNAVEDRLTSVGNEMISDGVTERLRELGV